MNKQKDFLSGPLVAASFVIFAMVLVVNNGPSLGPRAQALPSRPANLTSSIVAWISSQAESVIGELDAITRVNSQTDNFSIVNYIRYLELLQDLKIVAQGGVNIPELNWVTRKVKVFSGPHRSALTLVRQYLNGLNAAMSEIESKEPKSKQVGVDNKWMELYQTVKYIQTRVS